MVVDSSPPIDMGPPVDDATFNDGPVIDVDHADIETGTVEVDDDADDDTDMERSIAGNNNVTVELRDVDRDEIAKVDEFMEKGCGCTLYNNQPCYTAFSKEHLCCIRDQCSSFDRSTLSALLLGHVMATVHNSSNTFERRGHTSTERQRNSTVFMHEGIKVCHTCSVALIQTAFRFVGRLTTSYTR